MRYPGSRTLIASLSGLVLILATSDTFAAGPGVAARAGVFAAHPAFRPGVGRSFGRHRGRNNVGAFFWPGFGDWGDYDGSTPGGYGADVPPPPMIMCWVPLVVSIVELAAAAGLGVRRLVPVVPRTGSSRS